MATNPCVQSQSSQFFCFLKLIKVQPQSMSIHRYHTVIYVNLSLSNSTFRPHIGAILFENGAIDEMRNVKFTSVGLMKYKL